VAQLGLNEAPAGTLIYHNVAPREDDAEARRGNAGERLAYARLPTGVRVIGVNAGWAFSFVRDAAEELRWAAAPAEGSQFRSRDLFPQAASAIALVVSDGTFAVAPRQFAYAPGSSGWSLDGGAPVRWMELFLRGGNAWEAFGRPPIGAPIDISTT
jgi:hypothetical protein